MTLELLRDEDALTVRARGAELFRYVHRPVMDPFEAPKPYLHPVRTLAGRVVTGYRPHDHRWHKGVQFTASWLSGENFWGGGTYLRGQGYVDLPNLGTMRSLTVSAETDHDRAVVTEDLAWRTMAGERWIDERRTLTARDVEADSWTLEVTTALTNVHDTELVFGSPGTQGRELAGYSGLFWRGPREFTGGDVIGPGMGEPGDWLAFVGAHDEVDHSSTLLFLDDPDHPCQWFVRSEPIPAVNPSLAFDKEVPLAPGDTLARRYRIVVADGAWDLARLTRYVEEHPW
ncbi:PmoA family protein [Streptomyces sp. NPDC017868]|uniref:PmoA family protein n=1 Tax=Streptomyces sp. NPDC017868 TaxID=3365014 RepID=UPI00379934B5